MEELPEYLDLTCISWGFRKKEWNGSEPLCLSILGYFRAGASVQVCRNPILSTIPCSIEIGLQGLLLFASFS